MKKFKSIDQFRNTIREVRLRHDYQGKDEVEEPIYQHTTPYPVLKFTGTVKLHGTNAGIVKYADGRVEYQSRENVLSLEKDNAGFMRAMSQKETDFLFDGIEFKEYAAVYGEWCGQGIQSGVAISQLPKMFVVFAYNVDGRWLSFDEHPYSAILDDGIRSILQYGTCEVEIDFNEPELAQNKLIELTLAVEEECPVGKAFGVSGVGEGIVFSCIHDGHQYMFKSKGEKHSVSKVKTLAAVDTETLSSMKDFVDYAVTENRLKQGIDVMKTKGLEISQKNTGEFLRWIVNDVIKEEADTIEKNGFDVKKLNPLMSTKARQWYFNNIEV